MVSFSLKYQVSSGHIVCEQILFIICVLSLLLEKDSGMVPTVLNSKLFFLKSGGISRLSLFYYLIYNLKEKKLISFFPKGINTKGVQQTRPGFEHCSSITFSTPNNFSPPARYKFEFWHSLLCSFYINALAKRCESISSPSLADMVRIAYP